MRAVRRAAIARRPHMGFGECRVACRMAVDLAFRIGVNLVMYSLCLDYKTDQVHVPFIMRRRRWKPDDGATPAKPRKPKPDKP